MLIKQISIFVENKPGRLAEVTGLISKANIDIRALSIADTTNFGILRLIVDQPDRAAEVLREGGFTVSITDVMGIVVKDTPGGLYPAIQALSDEGVTVEYMYAFVNSPKDEAYVILRIEDTDRAIDILNRNHVPLVDPQTLYAM